MSCGVQMQYRHCRSSSGPKLVQADQRVAVRLTCCTCSRANQRSRGAAQGCPEAHPNCPHQSGTFSTLQSRNVDHLCCRLQQNSVHQTKLTKMQVATRHLNRHSARPDDKADQGSIVATLMIGFTKAGPFRTWSQSACGRLKARVSKTQTACL